MKIKIENEGNIRIEKINNHQRLLLRAAYIASFIRENNNLPHGSKKDFYEIQSWPISIAKEESDKKTEDLKNHINKWFEENLIESMTIFIYRPNGLYRVYRLIEDALFLPISEDKFEKEIIPAWLIAEISDIATKSIHRQLKNYLLS